jgi:hypothetical protein
MAMTFVVERCDPPEWVPLGIVEVSGDRAAAEAVERAAESDGDYRVWPVGVPVEQAECYRLGDGVASMIEQAGCE